MSASPAWTGGVRTEQELKELIEAVRANPRVAAVWYAFKHGITLEEAMEIGRRCPVGPEWLSDDPPTPAT